ncbi:UDP-N-acetylmuramate--L-alanine ligase [Hathewaya proteolytica DSM 3090]|uniref:UDP-N-acetylmuramate--L-alanine ligase n=1 Tax=Hathewaya proteolytica DSM 3090 TaxID=1121331 RepID=A0A1M6MAQ1_9CLOT|nr:UDP-N-acetylmuramate--L-alanine ligase [Hathewaya proteolytica]SHJ80531.1 UDP-N-acetylmuramate--L-alanine ligase [Hathewaya proteolytica DSM 3090]
MLSDILKNKNTNIFFIGIGGISMSGLAQIFLNRNYKVSGSDSKKSEATDKLEKLGAKVFIGQKAENISDADLIIYTWAISEDNPELLEARNRNLPIYTRAELLGELMKEHKYNIAISGTHGKTTTTSMAAHIALSAKLDPTILVGGNLDAINGNILVGNSQYLLTEACEYRESFTKFSPYVGVVLNIEEDHMDYYHNIDEIKTAFKKFINLIPSDGCLVANAEDKNLCQVIESNNFKCNIIDFGINKGRIQAKNISYDNHSCASFQVFDGSKFLFNAQLSVPGEHNILNALSAISAYLFLGIDTRLIQEGLLSFKGTHRRFEIKGVKNNITVIDDYCHHPTEIKASIKTVLNYPHKNIYCIFMPHTYSRTHALFNEFCTCFEGMDNLIITDIFPAREKDTGIINSQMLCQGITKCGTPCMYMNDFNEIVSYLKKVCVSGDVIITLGAGDAYKIGEEFLKEI